MTQPGAKTPAAAPRRLRIGEWEVDRTRNELARGGDSVRLEPKAIEVLVHLAAKPDEVVGREELLQAVWPGVVVGDDALTQAIIKLRKALGDDAHRPKYIETISKRGYRLIAPVERTKPSDDSSARSPGHRRRWKPVLAAAGVALVVVASAALRIDWRWPIGADPKVGAVSAGPPVIAVLPLANLSGDPNREYFSDGVTEDIIDALGRFSGLRVMSRSAVQPFREKPATLPEVRGQLGARYVVRGSVREADGRVRVAVELSDADKGTLLWSERYDGSGAQLFEIQDRIVKQVVASLQVKLTHVEQQRVFSQPPESLEAYDLVLRARSLLHRADRASNREARALLARARELAQDYPDAIVAAGEADYQRALYGWIEDARDGMERAAELARRALASADSRSHSRAHSLLAGVHSNLGDAQNALLEAERAIAINPSDSTALYRRGSSLVYAGRFQEGIEALESARRIEPDVGPGNGLNLAMAYHVSGRNREALAVADVVLSRYPRDVALNAVRAGALAELGEERAAREAAENLRRLQPMFRVEYYGTRFANAEHTSRVQEALRKAGF